MNYRLRITGFAKTALLVLAATAVSCIEPLELQPDIEGTITAFEVEDQTRTTINLSTRTVNIELNEGADPANVRVTRIELVETATCDIAVGDILDLSAPLPIVVTTVADYRWTISATQIFDPERPLPGGSFEEWYKSDWNYEPNEAGKVWNPWPADGVWEKDRWWDTGNFGVTMVSADSNSTPTEPGEGCPDNPSGRAARLESTWALLKVAGGNIYFGQFGDIDPNAGFNATCKLGHNWRTKPARLKGWYKYFPQPVDRISRDHLALNPAGLTEQQWLGSVDSLHVCVALWASPDDKDGDGRNDDVPFVVNTDPKNFVDFSRDAEGVLAYGAFVSNREQAVWDEFSIDIEYFIDEDEPLPANTQLYLLITASKNCNYFIAGTGSVAGTAGSLMYVDEVKLEY